MLVKLLGIVGGICFALCGVPAAIGTYRAKNSIGTPISIALAITIGAISMYLYLLLTYGFDLLLALNYSIEVVSWGLIVYYHFFPTKAVILTVPSKLGKVYNYKRDSLDLRDEFYGEEDNQSVLHAELDSLPSQADLRPLCSPVFDQGQVGSCTGNAAAGAFEFLQLKELRELSVGAEEFDPKKYEPASRLFIYYNERRMDNDTQEDAGATLRDAVKSLLYYGACPESMWPYVESKAFTKPTDAAYEDALSHRISKYYRFADFEHIKHSLSAGYPVIFGITLFESFESAEVAQTGLVPMPKVGRESVLGGHAVMIVGYDDTKQHVIVRNSWGTGWGDKGYFYLPYAYVQNPELASDFWTLRK
jgi:C1A family cysteine protease